MGLGYAQGSSLRDNIKSRYRGAGRVHSSVWSLVDKVPVGWGHHFVYCTRRVICLDKVECGEFATSLAQGDDPRSFLSWVSDCALVWSFALLRVRPQRISDQDGEHPRTARHAAEERSNHSPLYV
jgi:hypothetical protein